MSREKWAEKKVSFHKVLHLVNAAKRMSNDCVITWSHSAESVFFSFFNRGEMLSEILFSFPTALLGDTVRI